MADNIDRSNNRDNIAFLGSRKDVWHHRGQEMVKGMTIEQWAKAAGLDWTAEKAHAFVQLPSGMVEIPDLRHIVRSDNGHVLGTVSNRYHPCQPSEVLGWFEQYISVDERFQLDVAGSLKQGEIIWATATFNGGINVAGDNHVARLLMTTTFDGTGATINQGTMTRVVCNNTLNAALADKASVVKTRHNTRFNAERVGRELAAVAQGFDQYKAMGDAMGKSHMAKDKVSDFFKAVLDIPFDAKKDDISTRKMNQFADLSAAYRATVLEGTAPETAWTALNAVTRYVDHDRSTRDGDGEGRFLSSQFGSGAALKAKAVGLVYEIQDDMPKLDASIIASALSRPLVTRV